MPLAMYDPTSVLMYIADAILVEDVMDGSFIQIVKDTQVFTSETSTDGEIYRKRSSNNNYTVTLTLSATSMTSRILHYLLIADLETSVAKFPLFIKDTSGSTLFHATTCWIESQPNITFSQRVEPRTWIIKATGITTLVYGDNYGESSIPEDIVSSLLGTIPSLTGLI
jgi:hypothetical protein